MNLMQYCTMYCGSDQWILKLSSTMPHLVAVCGRQVSCATELTRSSCLHSAIMSLAMTSALPCAHAKAGCSTKAFRPQARSAPRVARSAHVVKASVADMEMVPDSNRRTVMNLLLVGAIGLPVASLAGYAFKQLLSGT